MCLVLKKTWKAKLKSNAYKTKLATFGSIDFPTIFAMAVLDTRIRKCLTFCAMPNSASFVFISIGL